MKDDFSKLGFDTVSVDALPEYRAEAIHLIHRQTGAEIYKIHAKDKENLFAYTFRTPPTDNSGVPHILEHAVLCGSQRYPLKDPFLMLYKGSAHTFLNAMTYPDKTVYPAASTVPADFLNLLRVYGDAVFFPNLFREAFEQEGHRIEFNSDGQLVRSGIVLNEMKGEYSSAENIAGDASLHSLFPDSPYRWDYGGDPSCIPELTYETFLQFHRTYYHPSNARIFLYGNHDLDEVLGILDREFLGRFERRDITSSIPLQNHWTSPQQLTVAYPSAPKESTKRKSTISVNWLWNESSSPDAALEAQILSHILLGHGGSPLQKAIIESGLGEDLSPISGLQSNIRQMVFSAAIRGTDSQKTNDFQKLIMNALESIAKGLNANLIEGTLRTVEFRAREIRGGIPFGLRLMDRAFRGWLHGRPPVDSLVFDAPMRRLRSRLKPGYFESLIHRDLLNNVHRTTVTVSPDPGLQERRDAEDRAHLNGIQQRMDSASRQAIKQASVQLAQFQNQPDSAEDLARIPFLSPADLPRKVSQIPMIHGNDGMVSWYTHETFCNGVSYLEMAFDLKGLDPELHPWLPLFGRALTQVGLPGLSHDEVARELAMKTGKFGGTPDPVSIHANAGGGLTLKFFVHLKALTHQWDEALDITRKILLSADFTDSHRVGELLVELRNDYRSAVVPSGHIFASARAASKHSEVSGWEDLWFGIGQLKFLQDIMDRSNGSQIAANALVRIRDMIMRQKQLKIAVTSDPDTLASVFSQSLDMVAKLPKGTELTASPPALFRHETQAESLSTASSVSFSALSLPAPVLGSVEHTHLGILAHMLRTGYLWETIRMKGGAYGASVSLSTLDGTLTFSTYRDPAIVSSIHAFREALDWACHQSDEMVSMAVVGMVGRDLRPLGPGERGAIGFERLLRGIDDGMRQQRRDTQLVTTADDVRMVAEKLIKEWDNRSITVIADDQALDKACRKMPELNALRIILPS